MRLTQQDIVEAWKQLGADTVGAAEIAQIQEAMLGDVGRLDASRRTLVLMRPAAIARILADHGAQLRHPEILEADTRWREQQKLHGVDEAFQATPFGQISSALFNKVQGAEFENDQSARDYMREMMLKLKEEFELMAASPVQSDSGRDLGKEMAHWLTLVLENPKLAREWIALRVATPEYKDMMKRVDEDLSHDSETNKE